MCAGTPATYNPVMNQRTALTVMLAAAAIAAAEWIDPLYLPLIALGPIVSGIAAGAAGVPSRLVALTWFCAGMIALLTDLVINQEDVAFHAVVALLTAGLGAAFTLVGGRIRGARPSVSRG